MIGTCAIASRRRLLDRMRFTLRAKRHSSPWGLDAEFGSTKGVGQGRKTPFGAGGRKRVAASRGSVAGRRQVEHGRRCLLEFVLTELLVLRSIASFFLLIALTNH